jgi:hypothetical protein
MSLPETIITMLRSLDIATLDERPFKGGMRRMGSDPKRLTAIEVVERDGVAIGITLLLTLHPGDEARARTSGALMAAVLDLVTPHWNTRASWLTETLKTFAKGRAQLLKTQQKAIARATHGPAMLTMTFSPAQNRVDFRVSIKPEKARAHGHSALTA